MDLTSDDTVQELYVAEWLADAFLASADDDADDDGGCLINGLSCVRVVLEKPIAPSQLVSVIAAFFSASHWYDLLASDGVPTPASELLALPPGRQFSAVHAEIDAAIARLGGRVFARMDHASSKTILACTCAAEVEANLRCSERTAARLRRIEHSKAVDGPARGMVMLRRWVDDLSTTHIEMRVFVHGGVARGVSMGVAETCRLADADERSCVACLALLKRAIKTFALRCVAATEYLDCVLDVAVPISALDAAFEAALALMIPGCHEERERAAVAAASLLTDRLWLIEVNTPVYLLATSGRFDLSSEAHREVLCGGLRPPEAITYPVLLAEFEWRTWMVELSQ